MVPYLLLLLFSFPIIAPTGICNERTACLYFITCYDESKVDPSTSRMTTDLSIWISLKEAVERKHECGSFGIISTLAIDPISSSTCNFSLETDQKHFEFTFGDDTQKVLEFKANDDTSVTTVNFNGKSKTLEVTKFVPKDGESLGRTIYSFLLEHNSNEMKNPAWGTCHMSVGDAKTKSDVNTFWEMFKTKLPCDVKIVTDQCKDLERCDKALINGHSISCEDSNHILKAAVGSAPWNILNSISCANQQWIINATQSEMKTPPEFNVICEKPLPVVTSTIPSTTTTTTPSTTTTSSPTTTTTAAATTRTIGEKGPVAIHQEAPPTTVQPEQGNKKRDDDDGGSGGGKWLWIGLAGGFAIIIVVVNIIVCVICFKKKNSTTKKTSKTQQPTNRNTKKKGGKGPEDSTTGVPSSSELTAEPSKASKESLKTPASGSAEKPVQPTSEPAAATEMGLDLLKTEKFN